MAGAVAVVGCGVVGSSIAYHLAREGLRPAVWEAAFPLRATSGSTHAWVWVQSKRPDSYAEMSAVSRDLYPDLERQIGPFEFTPSGGITPILVQEEVAEAQRLVIAQRAVGLSVDWLDPPEVARLEPQLTSDLWGAIYSPHDANVNPLRLVPSLIRAAAARGATFRFHAPVHLVPEGSGWAVVTEAGERHRYDQVVVAAGLGSRPLLAELGLDLPIHPVRGQIVVTAPVDRILRHTLSAMRQMENGELLIGYSHEVGETDRAVTLPYLASAAWLAVRWLPVLRQVPVVRAFAGLRVMPQDGLPILGPVPGRPGLSVAVMHSGYTLAPIVGHLASEWVRGERPSLDLTPYRMDRFAAPG